MRSMKALPCFVLAGALLCCAGLSAQSSSVAPRITANVDESSRTTLHGNVPRLARAEFDQGEAAPETQLTHVRLVLSRTSEQQAALDQYLADLQDASSPNYHKWLTPDQFGKLYGPADSDIAALVAWLESHGLQIETVSKGRTNIAFSGTVSQVAETFHTSIHSFQTSDQQFTSNTTDPQIPSALAAVVQGVAHLNTIRPRAHSVRTSGGNSESSRIAAGNGPRANLTEPSANFLYITPADAATIYNTPNAFNANFSSGTSYTGAGVNIGVGGDATIDPSIVGTYRSTFLGSATQPVLNYCTSPTSCSSTPASPLCTKTQKNNCYDNLDDADEAYLDTELSGAMAPGASIYYYASTDLNIGIEAALTANLVDIFSLSFGDCESDMVGGGNALINSYWQQAAGEGIAVTVSTGDSGSAGCDNTSDSNGNNIPDASGGLAVSGYASTPYNIAVGGTDFYGLENSFTSYVSTSFGSAGAPTYYRTATGHIPESIWNDSITNDTIQLSANVPVTGTCNGKPCANIVAGSGGASIEYSRPTWQTGIGSFDSGAMRDIPDVSLMAGNGADGATWLVCDGDTNTLAFSNSNGLLNCSNISGGYFDGFGGTSTSAPAFAGILALVQQSDTTKAGCPWVNCKRLGQAAQTLYLLYNSTHGGAIFHDTTVGNNSVPCTAGSANCSLNSAGHDFMTGYNTAAGYDMASGLGSVDATQLVNYWGAATGSAAATVNVNPSPNPATTIQPITVTVSVTGASGTPTGTVTLTSGSYSSGAVTIGSGTCTSAASCVFNISAGTLGIGTDTLTVAYSGDTNYAAKTNSSTTVVVNGLVPGVAVSAAATLNSNATLAVTVVTSASGGGGTPTGTLTLSATGTTATWMLTIGSGTCTAANCVFTIPVNTFTASGNVTLTAVYSGNSTYISANGMTTVAVTFIPVPTFSLTATSITSLTPGATTGNTSTVTVTALNGYTGTVTLTCALTNSPSGASYLPSCVIPSTAVSLPGTATATVNTTAATAAMDYPKLPGRGLLGAGGGAVLALLVFFGIPARRRSWRSMLGILVMMVALGTLAACGGGTPSGGGGISGTTAGNYTFTVTGTGTPAVSPLPTTTFMVTVN
jgi:subtilase family serine protease